MQYLFTLFCFLMMPLCGETLSISSPSQEIHTSYPDKHEIPAESTFNYWSEFFQMLLTLAFVILLIFLSVWILKKLMHSRVKSLNQSNGIKILERRPLGPKSAIYLIDVLGKGLVVAESSAGVHLLSELSENIKIEDTLNHLQAEKKPFRFSFREGLNKSNNLK